jgi:hypothetical protein
MTARQLPNGLWEVESKSDPDRNHVVDLQTPSCTCEHWTWRLAGTGKDCRHLAAARERAKARATFSTAARVPDALLEPLLAKHGDDPAIATALLYERERRKRREEANARMIEIWR